MSDMSIERFLQNLDDRSDRLQGDELRATSQELARAERTAITLEDRLRAAQGEAVDVHLRHGSVVHGAVTAVGPGWVRLVADDRREVLIPLPAVDLLDGLGPAARPAPEGLGAARSLQGVLRDLARDRRVLCVRTRSVEVTGRIAAVSADLFDIDIADGADGGARGRRRSVPTAALVLLRML